MSDLIEVEVRAVQKESARVNSYQLVALDGGELPAAEAGAHVDVHVSDASGTDFVRQYSLAQSATTEGYRIGVQREAEGKGGSIAVHETLQPGSRLFISAPRNLFPLSDDASHSILMGGGIGITPVLSMAWALHSQGRSFELHYSVRSLAEAAFIGELHSAPFVHNVHVYFAHDGARVDTLAVLANRSADTHLYACGPNGYMDSIWADAELMGWSSGQMHREYFDAPAAASDVEEMPFVVRLQSTGMEYEIPADKSAAQVLLAAGVDVPVSCEKGICGSCMCKVVDGTPDHRDLYQSEEEQASNQFFTPCCSRSRSPVLVLDM